MKKVTATFYVQDGFGEDLDGEISGLAENLANIVGYVVFLGGTEMSELDENDVAVITKLGYAEFLEAEDE